MVTQVTRGGWYQRDQDWTVEGRPRGVHLDIDLARLV